MFSRIERLLIALLFSLLAAGITLVVAQAQEGNPPIQEQPLNCGACHAEFQTTWMSGPHGQAGSDPIFTEEWTSQGKPGACLVCHVTGYDPATATWKEDDVSCEACHNPIPADHPKSPMPIDRSTDLCGRCHSDTRFGWQEWKVSTHYQRGMSCTVCHDPHSAALKKVSTTARGQAPTYQDASELCVTCHSENSMDFTYSTHHQQGVSCVDCHVKHLDTVDRTAHSVPDHSFNASLSSCNTCHADQMHSPGEALQTETSAPDAQTSASNIQFTSVTPEPETVSPIGFAGLAALIGLAAGMVLAPWLEGFYHRATKHGEETEDEQE